MVYLSPVHDRIFSFAHDWDPGRPWPLADVNTVCTRKHFLYWKVERDERL